MPGVLLVLALWMGQAISNKIPTVVHLPPNRSTISAADGGKLMELIHAPAEVYLPEVVPKLDAAGQPWQIEIRNAGPTAVTIRGRGEFRVLVPVGGTLRIAWNGNSYSRTR